MANKNNEPGKKILHICSELEYRFAVKKVDGEFVIYKNLGNGYDIVVSGLDNGSKKINAIIKVRLLYPETQIVETTTDITSINQLDLLLIITVEKYLNMKDNTEYMNFLFGRKSEK